MRRLLTTVSALALIGILPIGSEAAQVGTGDFGPGTQTTTFDGLGLPITNPAPLLIDGHTITTNDGTYRYLGIPSICVSNECIANNTDLGYIDIVLDAAYARAGAFVTGGFTGWTIRADFFDATDTLVGSFVLNNPTDAAPLFGGWEDPGGIARLRFTDLSPNNRIEALDNLMVQVVPEPSTALLFMSGLFAMAGVSRRQG